ncbi:hypothetical protein LJR219_003072 [Phenylobacterium sp. LjRoot219]|uniref:hypothetical protein n=1 Tax=Phenylobacterium sp. LjRoot219 TaxID=3342283 RepID=UPI003ECF25A4
MKMRVLTTVAAAAVLAASLSACQKKAEEANTGNTAEVAAPVDTANTMAPEAGNTAMDAGNAMAGNAPVEANAMAGNAMAGNAATGNAQ